jgi:hypothetical protein
LAAKVQLKYNTTKRTNIFTHQQIINILKIKEIINNIFIKRKAPKSASSVPFALFGIEKSGD